MKEGTTISVVRDHDTKPTESRNTRLVAAALASGGIFATEAAYSDTVEQIKELLDSRIRPAVAGDGGDITFRGFRDGIVYLSMKGACSGCPSSSATLKSGVENLLRHYIPEVLEVRPVAA